MNFFIFSNIIYQLVFDFISGDNIKGLRTFYEQNPGKYVNCRNNLGYTPLLQVYLYYYCVKNAFLSILNILNILI